MTPFEIAFPSGEVKCSAWHFPGEGDWFAGTDGRPVVVMAHGFGGTKDSGLQPFAERFAAAGLDAFAFDFRGFGTSEGIPRQSVSVDRQLEDYRAAVDVARSLPGVDPSRVVLWGSSMSGGHVMRLGVEGGCAAVVAMTPLTGTAGSVKSAFRTRDFVRPARLLASGVRSRVAVAAGREPTTTPIVGSPGTLAAMTLDGAYDSYLSIAGPTWRNEIDTAIVLEVARLRMAAARAPRCPTLMQIADFDRFVPANPTQKAAVRARAQVHHYPCDHFDVWPGHEWFEHVVADQVAFLRRVVRPVD